MQNANAGVNTEGEKYSMGKFRGTWNASVVRPAFNAFAFLPTAPPMKPRVVLKEEEVTCDDHLIDIIHGGDKLDNPPDDAAVLCKIIDRFKDYRGYISSEGTCFNNLGNCIGYINVNSEQAGTNNEEYLGRVNQLFNSNVCLIEDSLDEVAATLDLGLAKIADSSGSTVAELSNAGECMGHGGTYLGEFEGMTFKDMKVIALYLVLIDPGMLNEVEG